MSEQIFLGIDTSNYTTSVALLSEEGKVLANIKRPLPVKEGECGLRQSDAVFAHIKNLPSAMEEARAVLAGRNPVAVGVSTRPRNRDGSYMPCFLAGVSAAESVGATLGVPVYHFSHQCGHIMAAIHSSGQTGLLSRPFYAFHVSGGTTEALSVFYEEGGFRADLLGGSADLHAGQVIDRVGVSLGLPFPAGPALEKLALTNTAKIPSKKPSVKGTNVSLSGLENLAAKLLSETGDKALVAAFTFSYLSASLDALSRALSDTYGERPFLYAGGVMSNGILKAALGKGREAYFAEPALSADNAVGIAELCRRAHLS